jgi:hypothetical protein
MGASLERNLEGIGVSFGLHERGQHRTRYRDDTSESLTMSRAQRSPLRSSRALVATVVPIRMYSMRDVSIG